MNLKLKFLFLFYNLLIINQLNAQIKFNFDYASYLKTPQLDFKIDSSSYQNTLKIDWFSFTSPSGIRVKGFSIQLKNEKPHSAVIFQHEGRQSKEQFLLEAMYLAQSGLAAWAIDAPNLCESPAHFNRSEVTYVYLEGVKNLLLLTSILKNQFKIQQIAFVGHSLGANLGAILSAQTADIQHFILMTCPHDLPDFYQQINEANIQKIKEQTAKERFDIWLSMLLPLEAKNYLPQSKSKIFFQFAEDDEYISTELANNLFELCPQPKEIKFYSGGHLLNRLAEQDRQDWLLANLKNR
jgi:pimeloyl-ACP methyl ester carboxylesterase